MKLMHIPDENVRAQILDMLHKHASMPNGKFGTMMATEHRIDLEPRTRPVRSVPYRQGPAMRKHIKTEIEKMLKTGFTEPATSECASLVTFAPKKD